MRGQIVVWILALLMAVPVLFAWGRSHRWQDTASCRVGGGSLWIHSMQGSVSVGFYGRSTGIPFFSRHSEKIRSSRRGGPTRSGRAFSAYHAGHHWSVTFPHGALFLLAGFPLLPLLIWKLRRLRG